MFAKRLSAIFDKDKFQMNKKITLLTLVIVSSFFISWYKPFYFEMFPPQNVKTITQIHLDADGKPLKAGQVIREFSRQGQLIRYYSINHGPYNAGPHKDSVVASAATIAAFDSLGRVISYKTPGGGDFSLSSDLRYFDRSINKIAYLTDADSAYCLFNNAGKLLSICKYSKLREPDKIASKQLFTYDANANLTSEILYIKNSLSQGNSDASGDSLLIEESNTWVYRYDNKSKITYGYKMRYNNQYRINDTLVKQVTNNKQELLRTVEYTNLRRYFRDNNRNVVRNSQDSVCYIYVYEYYKK